MTIATLARGARQSLARGLEALQAVDAPPALLDVAQPVARAMGVLVELERAPDGLVAARVEPALQALREGLRLLQLPEHVEHPAAARGMAAVAETLGVVVELARTLEAQRAARASPPPARPEPTPVKITEHLPPAQAEAEPAGFMRTPKTLRPGPTAAEPPSAPRAPLPEKLPEPKVVIAGAASASPVRPEIVRGDELRAVEAPLGTNSPSNFYTGLSGGDVVLSGGLFVATYQLPAVGETVLLEISMPGGYEFIAKAIVAWTRSAGDTQSGTHSWRAAAGPPGFGARFSEITEQGHRLIQRYVRNREPLFHEDL
jgi:PilZ domain